MWYACGMLGFNLFIIYQFKVTYLIMIYRIRAYLIFSECKFSRKSLFLLLKLITE